MNTQNTEMCLIMKQIKVMEVELAKSKVKLRHPKKKKSISRELYK